MSAQRAVVVTGASTGIGEATTQRLAADGFSVFAGVRKEADGERLRGERIEPVMLDVTEDATVAAAANTVEEAVGDAGLAGLVNNAGIAVSGPLEFLPVAELRHQLEVNVVGQVAVTQAFLPAIRRARGRIVNIGSIGGRIALPLAGPYAASKFAMEAVTDTLRRELRPWGIEVSIIEPGGVRTPIWDRGTETANRLLEEAPPELLDRYGSVIDAMRSQVAEIERDGLPPSGVADVVHEALTAKKPRTRYLVGSDARQRARAASLLPDRAMDRLIARALKNG
jgi:NAD(P)-dependent dehydrogenase (short-subunit alcohol dehydrogenase family)